MRLEETSWMCWNVVCGFCEPCSEGGMLGTGGPVLLPAVGGGLDATAAIPYAVRGRSAPAERGDLRLFVLSGSVLIVSEDVFLDPNAERESDVLGALAELLL